MVNMSITNKCILKCPSCPSGRKNFIRNKPLEILPLEKCEQIFAKIAKEYGPKVFYLHIWNEPLLHPDIVEILAKAEQYGHSCALSTNLNVVADYAGIMKSPALKGLVVSFSGFSQEMSSRGHRGGNVKLALKHLKEVGKYTKESQATVVMNFHSYIDNDEDGNILEALCNKYGIVFASYDASVLQEEPENGLLRGHEEWRDSDDIVKLVLPRLKTEPYYFEKISTLSDIPCHSQYHILVLDHEGQVCTCTHKGPDDPHKLGDFLSMTSEELFETKWSFPICTHCKAIGMHMQYVCACFFEKASANNITSSKLLHAISPQGPFADKEIFVFGAGMNGGAVAPLLKHQGYKVMGFIDDNPDKIGTILHGIPVYSFDEIVSSLKGALILDTVRAMSVDKRLADYGLEQSTTVLSSEHFIFKTFV